MTIQRISTYGVHQNTLSDMNHTQSNIIRHQRQISSGVTAERFQDLAGQAEQYILLESSMRRSEMYITNNTQIISRLNHAQSSLQSLIGFADDIEDLITLRRNPATGDNLSFAQQMNGLQEAIVRTLNTSFEGRYLFSGTATNVPPITEPMPEPSEAGVPDSGYYRGSTEDLSARIDDGFVIDYSFRADEEPFQNLFAGISLSLQAEEEGGNDDDFARALDLVQESLQGLIDKETRVNSNVVIAGDVNDRHQGQKLYWQGLREAIINTDIVEVSTMLSFDQAVLQASYQAFASSSRLQLSAYL